MAAACLVAGGLPALAMPDQNSMDLRAKLEQLDLQLSEGVGPGVSTTALIEASGLSLALIPAETADRLPRNDWLALSTDLVEVQRFNIRLSLTMLAQAYGAEDNADILAAQQDPAQDALVIHSGNVRLADLRQILQETGMQRPAMDGPLELKVPLVIWSGASLQLGPGDVLHLSRPDGAYVVNFGHLQVQGATIAVAGGDNATSPQFVPFVTTADGGTVQVRGAHFIGLGFGKTQKFSGFSVMGSHMRTTRPGSWIDSSTFEDIKAVSISSGVDIVVSGNHFRNMRGSAIVASRSPGTRIVANLFSGDLPANAIILEEGSTGGQIAGNIVLGGQRTGIVVRNSSTGARVSNNIVWSRDGGGITLLKSDCGELFDNLVIDNGQKGIEVRTSPGARVYGNAVVNNHSAGIWISAQPKGALTELRDNVLEGNGSGLSSGVGENILLDGNDFSHQFPQFLSGDLAPQSVLIARNMLGQEPIVLSAAGRVEAVPEAPVCSN